MIELKVDEFENGKVVFHISRQDEEDYKILRFEKQIKLDSGDFYYLQSVGCPEIRNKFHFLVRGSMFSYDEICLSTSLNNYLMLFECIKKYNKEFC